MGVGQTLAHITPSVLQQSMANEKLLKIGIAGTVIAALCCFTPVLAILLGAVGLSAVLGVLDFVLIPVLIIFVGMTIYALWKRKNQPSS